MSVLYLTQHGAILRIRGERFLVTQGKKKILETPAIKVDQVVILGNGLISPQAMNYLLKNNVDVAYMSTSGQYRGRLQPPFTQNLPLRKAQFALADDKDFCLAFSKAIVGTKVRNSIFLLQKKGQKQVFGRNIKDLSHFLRRIEGAESQDKLLGLEGSASARYFQTFARLLKTDFGFSKRIKHPPPDPVNILLSLGYSLLFNLVHSMINLVGLDPFQGFFHRYKFGHATLASDLMEPLRAPIVDTLVLRLVNLQMITEKDFSKQDGKVILKKEGLRRYLEEYDKRLRTTRKYALARKSLDFRQIIEWQCRHLGRVLLGKEDSYRPFEWGR